MNDFKFNKMIAYEFSSLTQKNPKGLSHVTVLDCKHCNDPFLSPKSNSAHDARTKK